MALKGSLVYARQHAKAQLTRMPLGTRAYVGKWTHNDTYSAKVGTPVSFDERFVPMELYTSVKGKTGKVIKRMPYKPDRSNIVRTLKAKGPRSNPRKLPASSTSAVKKAQHAFLQAEKDYLRTPSNLNEIRLNSKYEALKRAISNQKRKKAASKKNPQRKNRMGVLIAGVTLGDKVTIPKGKRKGDTFTRGGQKYQVVSYISQSGKRIRYAKKV